jgi:hypothetical protein
LAGTAPRSPGWDPAASAWSHAAIQASVPLMLRIFAAAVVAAAAWYAATAAPLAAQDERLGRIVGTVVDAGTRQPVTGARIVIAGSSRGTLTDEHGRFALEAPAGTHTLEVEAPGFAAVQRPDVAVRTGQPVQLHFQLEPRPFALADLVVGSPYFSTPKRAPVSRYAMSVEEIRRAPGALGDVGRLIQSLPGIVPTSDQRNDLVVRGGSPVENLIIVDNMEVPNISHFGAQGATGGPINMINSELIRDATFSAGAFPAEHGNRLSSVLDISLREGSRERLAGSANVSVGGAALIAEGPLGRSGSWLLTGTRSYLDLVIGAVGFTAVPRYSNYQAKLSYDIGSRHRVWFVGLGGIDHVRFHVDEDDPSDPSLLDIDAGGWRNAVGGNWQRLLGDRGYAVLGVSDVVNAYDQEVRDAQLGYRMIFRDVSRERETTVKYDVVYQTHTLGEVAAGVSWKRFGTAVRIDQPLGLRNPYSADVPRTGPLAVDDRSAAFLHAAYAQLGRSVFRRLDVTAGIRSSRFGEAGAVRLSPRVGARYHLASNLSWTTGAGRYHQQPPLVYVKARPENAGLLPIRSDHYVMGLSYLPAPALRLSAEAFHKVYAEYPVSMEHPEVSLANLGDDFSVAGQLWRYTSGGTGRASGIELFLQQRLVGRLHGQAGYTYSRARHAGLDGVQRPGSFDSPHVFTVIAGYQPAPAWEVSARFTYASGRPLTPLDLEASTLQNRPILEVARLNSARSPAYHRLDLHGERRFNFNRWSLLVFTDIQNAYDRKNVFQYVWNAKTSERVAVNQMAFLPIVGLTVEF